VSTKQKTAEPAPEEPRPRALLFELETLAIGSRKLVYGAVKDALKSDRVSLPPHMFSRYCLNGDPGEYLPVVFEASGKKSAPSAKLADTIESKINDALSDGKRKLAPALTEVIAEAGKCDVKVGALSCLAPPLSDTIAANLGLSEMDLPIQAVGSRSARKTMTEGWLRLAKTLGVSPYRCLAVGTLAASCQAALKANMRCVAIPDELTSFQDFSGADLILETFDAAPIGELLRDNDRW